MKQTKDRTLSPEEAGYVLGLLKEHLDYYRALVGSARCSQKNRELYELVLGLWEKLAK
jgi:hypothetical protein